MTVTNQNVKIYRGDTASLPITVTMADGTPYDPTLNARIKWRLARTRHAPDSEVLVRKELDNGIALSAGGVTVTLGADDTDFPPAVYYHELKVFDGDDVATATTGFFVIRRALKMPDPFIGLILTGNAPLVAH